MAKQLPADAGNEGHGDEHRQENERDGNDRARDLGHGLLAGLRDRQLGFLLDHPLDVLDHHDGVIDHDADSEHEREQGDGIGGIADRQQHGERADNGYRHGNQRDQRRPQPSKEQKNNQRDERDCYDEGTNDLFDGCGDENRGVEEHRVSKIVRKAVSEDGHGLTHLARDLDRVRARCLIDAQCGGGGTVEAAVSVLRARPHLDASDVPDPDD